MSHHMNLNGMWKLSWRAIDGCTGVPECEKPIDGKVPGDVHEDLISAGLLPEPLLGNNASKHEWVENAVFTYERDLYIDADFDVAELVFNGLDCLASVYIDGKLIGSSANAHVPHAFDITNFIRKGMLHNLKVELDTGVQWAKKQDSSQYQCGDNHERMFLRKSQFSFKWDWAPRLVTCGIWRQVELKLYEKAIVRDVQLIPTFEGNGVTLKAKCKIEALEDGDYTAKLRVVRAQKWEAKKSVSLSKGINEVELELEIDPVERWYPAGYGAQALYGVHVELEHADKVLDSFNTSYGFREIKLNRDKIRDGEEMFAINVNGIDIFCKGANWVPADSLPARVTTEKYRHLVREAVDANFNMLRVWGGGIYEDWQFYHECDYRGIMVWQDFMFACTEYPHDRDWFIENISDEAAKAVQRLRNHPSIVLWCGNNECDWMHGYYERGEPGVISPFFGDKIYRDILPVICAEVDPTRPYWRSSPWGGDDPNCEQMGDRHAWNVSILETDVHVRADIRNYRKERGKFNSEYGVLSYALPQTILDYTGDLNIDFNSEAYKTHDNSFNQGLTDIYLKVGFGSVPEDELTYIYQSLAYQAMGYREAISNFRILKPECMGSLFWMYSDCWGTLGWTIVDAFLRRKPSYYWVRKAYAPLAVFVRVDDGVARTWVVNDKLEEISVKLKLDYGGFDGKKQSAAADIIVPANGVVAGPEFSCGDGYAHAQIERDGVVVSEDLILTKFPAEMQVPQARVDFQTKQVGRDLEVTLTSDNFGHFVYLDMPDKAILSDNYFNMIPNTPKVIQVKNAAPEDVKIGALNLR